MLRRAGGGCLHREDSSIAIEVTEVDKCDRSKTIVPHSFLSLGRRSTGKGILKNGTDGSSRCLVEMRSTPSRRISEQPYTYYCYVHNSTKCTEVVAANNEAATRQTKQRPLSIKRPTESDDGQNEETTTSEWKTKWAKAKRSARDTWRRTIHRQWTSLKKRPDDDSEDAEDSSRKCYISHSKHGKLLLRE